MTALHESESMTTHSPPAPSEVDELHATFDMLLRGPSGDGSVKRHAGAKPFWKVDPDHGAAAERHRAARLRGERYDATSGFPHRIHEAWRNCAAGWQEMVEDGWDGVTDPATWCAERAAERVAS
jgi:hypothetical protein